MIERRLPNRHKHRTLPVLSFAEQDGLCCFDLSRPVKDVDRFEGERED